MADDFIQTEQAAAILGCSDSLVRRYLRLGRLLGRRFGGLWLVSRRSAEAFKPDPRGPKPRKPAKAIKTKGKR